MDVDTIEDEVSEVVKEAAKNGLIVPVALGLLALGAGIGIGYILGRRTKYEVIKLGDRLPPVRPPRVIIDANELRKDVKADAEVEDDEGQEVVVTVNEHIVESNIFAHTEATEDDWNYEDEVERRNPLSPYVIHHDEFHAREMAEDGYLQSTLTFYVGDETLVDEDEKPIYDQAGTTGPLLFGHGSGDPNVVYVRNMTRAAEYEIIRDPGHYRVEVLGLAMETEAEAKAEKQSRQRKFRQE